MDREHQPGQLTTKGRQWAEPSQAPGNPVKEDHGVSNRRKWTAEEDARLRAAVQEVGPMSWRRIANMVGTRNHYQCTQRWRKVLSPGLCKGGWSAEEDAQLIRLYHKGFSHWGEIAEKIKGRTAKQCRERWFHHLDPGLNRAEWSKEEDFTVLRLHDELGNQWSKIAQALQGRSSDAVKNRVGRLRSAIRRGGPEFDPSDPGSTVKCRPQDVRLGIAMVLSSVKEQCQGLPPPSSSAKPAADLQTQTTQTQTQQPRRALL